MVVISYPMIRAFLEEHKDAKDPLNNWYTIMTKADFANFNQMRKVFATADAVGNDRYVFNIKGNHYRLVAMIHFKVRTVYIRYIASHKEYDRLTDIGNI